MVMLNYRNITFIKRILEHLLSRYYWEFFSSFRSSLKLTVAYVDT
jgi:ribosomal protein S17E